MKLLAALALLFVSLGTFSQVQKIDLFRSGVTYYNQSLVGRCEATREHGQDTAITPASEETSLIHWYDQRYDSVWYYNLYNHPLTGAKIPFPVEFTIDTRTLTQFTRVGIWIGNNVDGNTGAKLKVMTGTPFKWEDTVHTITADATNIYNKWHKFTVATGDTNRFLHIEIDGKFPALGEIVIYGNIYDTIPPDSDTTLAEDTYHRFGVNSTGGDGYEKDAVTPVWHSKKIGSNRQYEFANYTVAAPKSAPESLINGNGFDTYSTTLVDTLRTAGVNLWVVYSTTTLPSQWKPWITQTSNLVQQKSIDWTLGAGGDTTAGGIPYFNLNRVAEDPASYAHAAWYVRKLAIANRERVLPIKHIEPGNEYNGPFQDAGRYAPNELAAFCSAMYDGHENTLTYNSQSCGVKNNSYGDIKMLMPALDVYNLNYLKCMEFWFYWNRTDHKFAADIGNAHDYPNTSGGQGLNGKGLMPESYYHLKERMIEGRKFFAKHNMYFWNTEIGYDNYDSISYRGPYCTTATFGNSFVNTPHVWQGGGQSIEETNGNMIARTMLVMASAEVPYYNFWLADRFIKRQTCGTFGASGLLGLDTIKAYVPYYYKRPAWYYFLTVDSLLKGYGFMTDTLVVSGTDSIRIQRYRKGSSSTLYAVWSPTVKNASFSFSVPFTTPGPYQVIRLSDSSEVGMADIEQATASSVSLTITEKPIFIRQANGAPPGPNNTIRKNIKFEQVSYP